MDEKKNLEITNDDAGFDKTETWMQECQLKYANVIKSVRMRKGLERSTSLSVVTEDRMDNMDHMDNTNNMGQ